MDCLPSWRDGPTKQAIVDYIEQVNRAGVPSPECVAVFDNDGTPWCEKPMYIQLDFLLGRLAARAETDATLRQRQPWKAAYENDFVWLGGAITKHYRGDDTDLKVALGGIVSLSDGVPPEQVEAAGRELILSQSHPTLGRRYVDCIYQPMVELLRYLEANGFTIYIASGGGRDFIRGFAHDVYGIPRERVIGSTVAYRYVERDGKSEIVQQAALDVIDDGPGKPVQIWNVIGRRPILACGNSNGDVPMLQFSHHPTYPSFRLLVLHDDAEREMAYEGGAEQALALARSDGWTVVSMQHDWSTVFSGR